MNENIQYIQLLSSNCGSKLTLRWEILKGFHSFGGQIEHQWKCGEGAKEQESCKNHWVYYVKSENKFYWGWNHVFTVLEARISCSENVVERPKRDNVGKLNKLLLKVKEFMVEARIAVINWGSFSMQQDVEQHQYLWTKLS